MRSFIGELFTCGSTERFTLLSEALMYSFSCSKVSDVFPYLGSKYFALHPIAITLSVSRRVGPSTIDAEMFFGTGDCFVARVTRLVAITLR